MEKTLLDFMPLEEGVNDPAIFKAVFLAGGPGSGKSFIVGKTALTSFGFKVVNSDQAFEASLKKAGLETTPENIFSVKGQSLRDRASLLTKRRQSSFINGRLGLVIDGTGKDFEKIRQQKIELEKLGYETAMILVNTNLDTAVSRDQKRARTLGKERVEPMWKSVQNNIGKFQNLFGNQFIVVDNSDGANYEGGIMSAYRKIGQWARQTPNNHHAQRWIRDQKQRRGMNEDLRNWFSKSHPKGDWVRVGTDGEIKGQCAREPGEGKPKCMPRQKAHSMSKDDRATSARRKRRKDPVADRSGKGGKPIMVKTDVKEAKVPAGHKFITSHVYKGGDGKDHTHKHYRKGTKITDPVVVHIDGKEWKTFDRFTKAKQAAINHIKSMRPPSKFRKEEKINEAPQWMQGHLAKTIYKTHYKHAYKLLKSIVDRKKKEGGGKLRHDIGYYAAKVAPQVSDKVDPRTLASMYEDVQISRYEWGRPEGTQYFKALTPGEPGTTTKKNKTTNKYHYKAKEECGCDKCMSEGENHSWKTDGHYKKDGTEYKGDQHAHDGQVMTGKTHTKDSENLYHFKDLGKEAREKVLSKMKMKEEVEQAEIEVLEMDVDSIFSAEDIADMEIQIDNMDFDDMVKLGMYDPDELEDFEAFDEDDEDDDSDIHDNVDILEVLSIQGRMKRRFNARRNRQKLKVARMRASRRAGDPARLKRRATRGARNMVKGRLARGRDISSLPPAEKARIEMMAKRFSSLVSRLATRMLPQIRKNELKRLTSRGGMKAQKAKKYKASSAKASAAAQKGKKFKVKKK